MRDCRADACPALHPPRAARMQLQRERGGCRNSAGLSETLSTVEKVSQVEELTRGVRAGHQRRLPLVSSTIRRRALPLRGGSALGPRVKLVRCEYTRTPRSHVRNTLQIKLTNPTTRAPAPRPRGAGCGPPPPASARRLSVAASESGQREKGVPRRAASPPPSCTERTRLVPPSVLIGHVSSLPLGGGPPALASFSFSVFTYL